MKGFLIFSSGLAIGSLVTLYCVKDHYAKLANEEIDSVKDHFHNELDTYKSKLKEQNDISKNEVKEEETVVDYKKIIDNLNYGRYSTTSKKEDGNDKVVAPYPISDEEYCELNNGYDKITLHYYEDDDQFLDDNDELVENAIENVGTFNLAYFGEFTPNVLYIRNDLLACDYEIIKHEGAISDGYDPSEEDY